MTKEELKIAIDAIKKEANEKTKAVLIEYAKSNSTVKIGDIVTDHIGSIRVEKIGTHQDGTFNTPSSQAMYTGVELKKDLTPTKKGTTRTVFQSNLNDHGA